MIQKAVIGAGFRGVLNYVFKESKELEHDRARIVGGNMAGADPRALAREFGAYRRLNTDVDRPVYHCALRLADDERLTDTQWGAVVGAYLERMGFGDTPYVVVAHADHHVHIVASRVRFDGSRVDLWQDRPRSNRAVHELEREYGLSHAIDPARLDRGPRPRVTAYPESRWAWRSLRYTMRTAARCTKPR